MQARLALKILYRVGVHPLYASCSRDRDRNERDEVILAGAFTNFRRTGGSRITKVISLFAFGKYLN